MSRYAYLHATSTKWALSLALLGALGACGGGGGGGGVAPTLVANTNLTATASSAVLAAVVPAAGAAPILFSFPAGFSDTGSNTIDGTNVAFTSAVPAFSITNGTKTATGATTFGSCIFTVASTTFTSPSPLATIGPITVNPCTLTVNTIGAIANGVSALRNVILTLGLTPSTALSLPVTISSTGVVAVNGVTVGTVTVVPTTGTTGAGG